MQLLQPTDKKDVSKSPGRDSIVEAHYDGIKTADDMRMAWHDYLLAGLSVIQQLSSSAVSLRAYLVTVRKEGGLLFGIFISYGHLIILLINSTMWHNSLVLMQHRLVPGLPRPLSISTIIVLRHDLPRCRSTRGLSRGSQ